MNTYNANYWELYSKPSIVKLSNKKNSKKGTLSKAEQEQEIKMHNTTIKEVAEYYSSRMKNSPSELEKRMQEFLNNHEIKYEFQRIIYIKGKKGRINKFYIADFFIPSKNLIIEVDGKFHNLQIKEDAARTKDIQRHYPSFKVVRWKWQDFSNYNRLRDLVRIVKN